MERNNRNGLSASGANYKGSVGRSCSAGFVRAYIYLAWFCYRNFKSSFRALKGISLVQVASAPGFLIGCYIMAIYYLAEIVFDVCLPVGCAYSYALILILMSIFIIKKHFRTSSWNIEFKGLECIPRNRRIVLDAIVWLVIVLAIPTALATAVFARNKFMP